MRWVRRRVRRRVLAGVILMALLLGVRAGRWAMLPVRPFVGRWGYGGIAPGYEYRRNGVLLTYTCTGVDRGRWKELPGGVLREWGSGWGPVDTRWRASADGKTLWLGEQAYPRTGPEGFSLF